MKKWLNDVANYNFVCTLTMIAETAVSAALRLSAAFLLVQAGLHLV